MLSIGLLRRGSRNMGGGKGPYAILRVPEDDTYSYYKLHGVLDLVG